MNLSITDRDNHKYDMNKSQSALSSEETFEKLLEHYSKQLIEKIDFSSKSTKIEVSKDVKTVYYGGDGLGLNNMINLWFIDEGLLATDFQYCTLKSIQDGKFIINDFRCWDLVMVDRNMEEISRLKGRGTSPPIYYKSISTRTWYDDQYITWLSSPLDVSAVRVSDFTYKTVEGFWLYKNQTVQPLCVVLGKAGDLLVGIGEVNEQTQTLHYYDNNTSDYVMTAELSVVLPQGRIFTNTSYFLFFD